MHVSHKLGDAYDEWKLEEHAQMAGLRLVKCAPFVFEAFPGYRTRRGAAKEAGKRFPLGQAATYIFCRNMPPATSINLKMKIEHDYSTVMLQIANVKAELVQKGRACEETTPVVQVLADEVTRLEKQEQKLGKMKMVKLKSFKSALKDIKVAVLEEETSDLPFLNTTSELPICLRFCEYCGAEFRRRSKRQS